MAGGVLSPAQHLRLRVSRQCPVASTMTDLGDVSPLSSLLQPLLDMIEEPSLRDLAQETARIYYQVQLRSLLSLLLVESALALSHLRHYRLY